MGGESILIADDDVRNVEFLRDSLLGPGGYTTLCASDGEEALRLAVDQEPDLIILDLQIPKMDGLQVLEALRRESRHRHVSCQGHGKRQLPALRAGGAGQA
ncbi:MAG TPA: response regulator [Anaerolineae bacterium]|nr:response regulator [Anaerolineae bacterium]